jgi:hypothetical protein
LSDAICVGMFIEPQISLDGEHQVEGKGARAIHRVVPIEALEESEIREVIELAFESIADAARFRGDGGSADAGADREDVVDEAKRPPRSRSGKRGGART